MTLNIERLGGDTPVHSKGIILGPHGIGKTSLIRSLPEESTLLVDLEAGKLALGARTENGVKIPAWKGLRVDAFAEAQRLKLSVWEVARGIAVWLGGPSPFVSREEEPYGPWHYDFTCKMFGDPAPVLEHVNTIFVDSISVASRSCFQWGKGQARGQVEKGDKRGQVDTRGLYGLVKDEMLQWLTQLQHTPKNVWSVGGLDRSEDDGKVTWRAQVEGAGTGNALPGIVDEVISYVQVNDGVNPAYRGFVTQTLNQWGYPAKDRSGALEAVEEPNLAKLMAKLAAGAA